MCSGGWYSADEILCMVKQNCVCIVGLPVHCIVSRRVIPSTLEQSVEIQQSLLRL